MPKERNKADGYREKAYEGDTKAMNNLGVCYERGTGVKVNLELAFEWYMKAAKLGDVYGCFNVGECYYHGKGVEQNTEQAFEWYMKAADKGDMQSQVNVANAYYLGNGTEMDHHKKLPTKGICSHRSMWPMPIISATAQRQITIKHSSGIVRQPSKDMYRVRRTAVRPIGMAMA